MTSGHVLREAVRKNNVPLAQQLLAQHTTTSVCDKEGYTPLHWAALNGSVTLTRLLLASGANPCALDKRNRTPIQIAAENNFWNVVALYSVYKTDKTDKARYQFALERAVMVGKFSVAKLLLEANTPLPETTATSDGLLHISVRKNFAGIAKLLGINGVNFETKNAAKLTAVQLARNLSRAKCEASILDLNKKGEELFNAAAANKRELVRELLDRGISPWIQIKQSCALLQTSDSKIISLLLAAGDHSYFKKIMILKLYYRALEEKNWTHGFLAARRLEDKYLFSQDLSSIMHLSTDQENISIFLGLCVAKKHEFYLKLNINNVTTTFIPHIPPDTIAPMLLSALKNALKQGNLPFFARDCLEIGMYLFANANEYPLPDKVISLAIIFFAHSPKIKDVQTCKVHCYLYLAEIATVEQPTIAVVDTLLSADPLAKTKLHDKADLFLKKYLEYLFPVSPQAKVEAQFLVLLLQPVLKLNSSSLFFKSWFAKNALPCLPIAEEVEKKSLAKN